MEGSPGEFDHEGPDVAVTTVLKTRLSLDNGNHNALDVGVQGVASEGNDGVIADVTGVSHVRMLACGTVADSPRLDKSGKTRDLEGKAGLRTPGLTAKGVREVNEDLFTGNDELVEARLAHRRELEDVKTVGNGSFGIGEIVGDQRSERPKRRIVVVRASNILPAKSQRLHMHELIRDEP